MCLKLIKLDVQVRPVFADPVTYKQNHLSSITHLRWTHAFLSFLFMQNLQVPHLDALQPGHFPHLLFFPINNNI